MVRTSTRRTGAARRFAAACALVLAWAPASAAVRGEEEPRVEHDVAAAFQILVDACAGGDPARIDAAVARVVAEPRGSVRAEIVRATDPARPDVVAEAGLAVLASAGLSDDVALCVALHRPVLADRLESAFREIARRDPRTLGVLESASRSAVTDVRTAMVRAVAGLESYEAVSWLARCGERHADVRGEAVARLGLVAESLLVPIAEEAAAIVRDVLADERSAARREAIVAAGRIRDDEAVPLLIDALDTEDRGVALDAAWALARITGIDLRDRRDRWESWYATELAWWQERSESAFESLESGAPPRQISALVDLTARRGSRDRIAARVAPLLESSDPAVARHAARTLGILGSKAATRPLVRALESPDPDLADAAWTALRSVTRKDVPNDPARWQALAGS